MESSRRSILDEFETVTSTEILAPTGNTSQGSASKDIKVITKAMEKLVMDIKQLKLDNTSIKAELTAATNNNQLLKDRMEELEHSVSADQKLHEWQVDASQESGIETSMSKKEIHKRLEDYAARRRQFGMN